MPSINDLYPSRCGSFGLIKRVDPIIDNDKYYQGPILKEAIKNYEKNGFMLMRNLFNNEEVLHIKRKIYGLRDHYESLSHDDLAESIKMKIIAENNNISNYSKSNSLKSIWQVHLCAQEAPHMLSTASICHSLAHDSRLVDSARQILGEEVYIHQSRINFQQGWSENSSGGSGFLWHQDFEQWHSDDGMPRMRALSVALLLEDSMPENGALMVIPGSHNSMIQADVPNSYNNSSNSALFRGPQFPPHYLKEAANRNGIVYCNGKAGDVVIFDCNILHGSHTNISPWNRCMIFFVYNSVSNTLQLELTKGEGRPEYISCRDKKLMGKAIPSVKQSFANWSP